MAERGLVLSLFSGAGLLDHAFSEQGFCVVSAGDVIGGSLYDIRKFHPPAGRFDGVIGGDPCQSHSSLANLVRAKGQEPRFPDMTPEYQRIVEEARPAWFLRENVPNAPDIKPRGYHVRNFLLDNWASLGEEQSRRRRFWFGVRDGEAPELRRWIDFALEIPPESAETVVIRSGQYGSTRRNAICGDARSVPVALGGSGKVKATAVGTTGSAPSHGMRAGHTAEEYRARRAATAADGRRGHREGRKPTVDGSAGGGPISRRAPVTGRHDGHVGSPDRDYSTRYTLEEMLELQGLPADFFEHSPFTVQGKRKLVGNAVAMPTGRAIAKAVRCAIEAMACR